MTDEAWILQVLQGMWRRVEDTDSYLYDSVTVLVSDGEELALAVWDNEREVWLDSQHYAPVVTPCIWWMPAALPPGDADDD